MNRATELSRGGVSARKIPAKLVYELVDGDLVLAWNVEIEETSFDHWWSATVDAETGELLSKVDYVDHDNANNVALSLASNVGISASALAPAPGKGTGVGDGSSYNVCELPKESPLDGPRTIVDDPAHFIASLYGWHDTDGADGPEFTVTRGNNVLEPHREARLQPGPVRRDRWWQQRAHPAARHGRNEVPDVPAGLR